VAPNVFEARTEWQLEKEKGHKAAEHRGRMFGATPVSPNAFQAVTGT
jgi:hypothetical protein